MIDVSIISDPITVASQQGLGFANSLLYRQNFVSSSVLALSDVSSDHSGGLVQISAALFHANARPPVSSRKTVSRTRLRKKPRTKLKSYDDGDFGDTGAENGFFGGDGEGPSWGSGGGSGGGGWSGGSEEQNWDESSWSSSSRFAYGFIRDVFLWIALATCVQFAFKRIMGFCS